MAQMSSAWGPRRADSRSFISFAALLVKVMAITLHGTAGSRAHSRSARNLSSSERGSQRASRNETSSSVTVSGTKSLSLAQPNRRRFAIRFIKTVVFPLPAPARSSSGPCVVRTAWRCISLSWENWEAIYCRRAARKRDLHNSVMTHLYHSVRMRLFYSKTRKR